MMRYGRPSALISRSARSTISLQHARALLGRGDREDLDLVELVGAQHAAGVATGRAGLAAVARRVRHHPLRQLRVVEHLAGVDRGERHLGGGDAPQVVALDGVRVVGELRQLTGGRERGGGDQRRRADLLERVGVHVERVLAQRTGQRGAGAALHGEHRAADLGGPLVVEDAQRRGRLPVRHPLVLGELVRQVDRARDHRVVVLAGTVGRVGVRQVGDAQQQVAQLGLDDVELGGQHPLLLAQGAALGLQRLGPSASPASRSAHLLRQVVDLGAQGVALATMSRARSSSERPPSCSSSSGLLRRAMAARTTLGLVAQQSDVDHRNARLLDRPWRWSPAEVVEVTIDEGGRHRPSRPAPRPCGAACRTRASRRTGRTCGTR